MEVSISEIKKLRDMTGAGMMAAKEALVETKGDLDKAVEALRRKGAAGAAKRAHREATAGVIDVYMHGGKMAAMVEVNCETDFVARTDDFKNFAHELAMQVAASAPEYLSPDQVPGEIVDKEKNLYMDEVKGKPEAVVEKILTGKLEKFYQGVCLLKQPYIKDPDRKVEDLLTDLTAKMGENIVVRRFVRWELGEEA
jgi:elongation factor Ts